MCTTHSRLFLPHSTLAALRPFLGCRFEVETDGEYVRILDVSLEKVTEDDEPEDEDEETVYGGPVGTPGPTLLLSRVHLAVHFGRSRPELRLHAESQTCMHQGCSPVLTACSMGIHLAWEIMLLMQRDVGSSTSSLDKLSDLLRALLCAKP